MNTVDYTLGMICFFILFTVFRMESVIPPLIRIFLSLIAMGIGIYLFVKGIMEMNKRKR